MRIDDQNLTGISSTRTAGTEGVGSSSKAKHGGKSGASNDEVQLSSLANALNQLGADSPERVRRLERLTAEVQSGRYQVDAKVLSSKIVSDALSGGRIEE